MGRSTIFDGALVTLGFREAAAGTSAEALAKDLYAAADVLYDVRGSVRAVTTDGLNDAKEGYAFRLGPIPSGSTTTLGLVTELRNLAQKWDFTVGKIAGDMEWLGKTLNKFPKTAVVKTIRFRTRPLGEGVTTEEFVTALGECSKVLLGNMKETRAVIKTVAAEVKNPMGLFQHSEVMIGAKDLLERQGVWELDTKNFAEGCKALATALKAKTASKLDLYENALTKLATMDDAKRSRFEEGKPADPTENMSPADAAEWKKQNDKNKDKFKSGMAREAEVDKELLTRYRLELDTAIEALKSAKKSPKNPKKHLESALRSIGAALGQLEPEGSGPASEALFRAADKMNTLRPVTDFAKSAAKADVDLLTDIKTALKEKDAGLLQSTLRGVSSVKAVQHTIEALLTTGLKLEIVRDLLGGKLSLKASSFDAALLKLGKHYTFDGACEAVKDALKSTKEADALIAAAQEQKDDSRSARDLAREFKLEDALGLDEATKIIKAIQE
jgi:hypothetical protein